MATGTVSSFCRRDGCLLRYPADATRPLRADCHFWSNFEIASLKFWRSPAYEDYFNHLDKTGNFFYERTGDAPVHSIGKPRLLESPHGVPALTPSSLSCLFATAASLFLPASALHHFADISYEHNPYQTCPTDVAKYHDTGKCQVSGRAATTCSVTCAVGR